MAVPTCLWIRQLRWVAAGVLLLGATPVFAQSPAECTGFEWNMSSELALFQTGAHDVRASAQVGSGAVLTPGVLYDVVLLDQPSVRFALEPAGRRVVDAPQAGILSFRVPRAGHYRISADGPVWIDVINGTSALQASAFNGHARCSLIHKSVDFALPGSATLTIQFSQSPRTHVRLAITPAPVTPEGGGSHP